MPSATVAEMEPRFLLHVCCVVVLLTILLSFFFVWLLVGRLFGRLFCWLVPYVDSLVCCARLVLLRVDSFFSRYDGNGFTVFSCWSRLE